MTPHTFYVIVAFFVFAIIAATRYFHPDNPPWNTAQGFYVATFCIGYALGLSALPTAAPTPTPLEAPCPCPSLPTPKP